MDNRNTFQFVPTEDNNLVLFIYAREGEANRPLARLLPGKNTIEFYRSGDDAFELKPIDDSIFANLEIQKKLLVCEILPAEHENEVEICNSYVAEITK
jgi:hypothetical protein